MPVKLAAHTSLGGLMVLDGTLQLGSFLLIKAVQMVVWHVLRVGEYGRCLEKLTSSQVICEFGKKEQVKDHVHVRGEREENDDAGVKFYWVPYVYLA